VFNRVGVLRSQSPMRTVRAPLSRGCDVQKGDPRSGGLVSATSVSCRSRAAGSQPLFSLSEGAECLPLEVWLP